MYMERKTRAERFARHFDPNWLREFPECRGAWFEDEKKVEEAINWGKEKAALLRWVRRMMGERLTKREQYYLELYYFRGLTYIEAGRAAGKDPSTIHRAVKRGIRKLRFASQEDTSWRNSVQRFKH